MNLINWLKRTETEIEKISIKKPLLEFYIFGGYSLFFLLIVFFFSLLIKSHPMPLFEGVKFTDDLWYIIFIKLIFLLTVPVIIFKRLGYSVTYILKLRKSNHYFAVFFAFLIGCLLNLSHLSGILPLISPNNTLRILAGTLLPLICAAIPEELFYRAMLQTRVEKLYGWSISLFISSIMFSLFHLPSRLLLSTGVEGLAGNLISISTGTLLPTFILGLVFAFLWNRYRNIYLLIALHYGIDLLPSLSSMLA